jgi:FG-GAP-like repeat
VHTDTVAAPATLAASVPGGPAAGSSGSAADPVTDGRGITWAVDKYSGDVAYVAADNSVHVVSTGVPSTPPVIVAPTAAQLVAVPGFSPAKNGGWTQQVTLSRPVTSWTLTFRKAGTAAVAYTQSGGATGWPSLSWNGYLPSGAKAYSGTYDWSLSVTTPGSTAPVTVPGSTQIVECGQIPFRSYDCDGTPALLAVHGPDGYSHWYDGTASGGLSDNGATDDWSLCSGASCDTAIIPFGDINGDGYADLLVRTGNGQLRAYLGFGQAYFGNVKSISLGTGWNAYNALVYAGDLNRDGHPDLVARDTAGRLWLFASTGTGGFHARTLIGSGWGGYTKLIGAGDLTGDGVGDLLAIDKAGVMWLFVGNGHGGFLPARYKVGTGWAGYNAVIGIGDLSGDGCNDIVARDTHGTLWRFNGNCKGGLAKPVKISAGWQKYQALF